MKEFKCSNCGYRKWQKDQNDYMLNMPIYGYFIGYNMVPMDNFHQDQICPNCKKAFGWNSIINNDNF